MDISILQEIARRLKAKEISLDPTSDPIITVQIFSDGGWRVLDSLYSIDTRILRIGGTINELYGYLEELKKT